MPRRPVYVRAAALTLCSFATIVSAAAHDEPTRIRLSSGEELTVTILERTSEHVRFSHPVLGELTLPAAAIIVLTDAPPPPPEGTPQVSPTPEAPPTEKDAPTTPPADAAPAQPDEDSFFQGWTGSVEGGVSGSEGNTRTLSLRFGVSAERITELMETRAGFNIAYSEDRGKATQNRGEFNVRNDWLFKDSPWGFFAQGRVEYDQFKDWDLRVSTFAGPSYAFIRNDTTLLRGRIGAGVTANIGPTDEDHWVPEGLLGIDFKHKITERQSIFANAELLPNLTDFFEYRANLDAGYEVLLDTETNLFLKLGVSNRYNSNPGDGVKKNDFDYFMTLGWKF